jgi:hypothetical protein
VTLVRSDSLFVNWADFPSMHAAPSGTLMAHWLVRGPTGGVDYRIEAVRSDDLGATWSVPWTPHVDGTASEHGFVSYFDTPTGETGLAWLDGRDYAAHADGSAHASHTAGQAQMSLRARTLGVSGEPTPEVLLDERTCDCCQTAAAVTRDGPIVAYRDRSEDEIRDISVVRWTPDGWTAPVTVHEDGWRIEGCPVNGPALAARETDVILAWYTAAHGVPRVNLAFSLDAGRSFGEPIQIDDGHPEGRVDVVLDQQGTAWVSWLERTDGGADVRVRRVRPGSAPEASTTVAASSEQRVSGFPRMARPAGSTGVFALRPARADPIPSLHGSRCCGADGGGRRGASFLTSRPVCPPGHGPLADTSGA